MPFCPLATVRGHLLSLAPPPLLAYTGRRQVGLDSYDLPESLLRAFHTTAHGVRCYLLSQRHASVTLLPDGSAAVEALATLQASHQLVLLNGTALPKGPAGPGGGGGAAAALAVGDRLTLLGGVNKGPAAIVSRAGDLTFTLRLSPAVERRARDAEVTGKKDLSPPRGGAIGDGLAQTRAA